MSAEPAGLAAADRIYVFGKGSFAPPPPPPGGTMLTELERIRCCKINALFCPDHQASSSQHCTTGGGGGARDTCAVEKKICPTGAEVLGFKDATSVYFATTGIRFRGKIANFGRRSGSLCGFDTSAFGVVGTEQLPWGDTETPGGTETPTSSKPASAQADSCTPVDVRPTRRRSGFLKAGDLASPPGVFSELRVVGSQRAGDQGTPKGVLWCVRP